jgi:very-short-patch-repair endonuclease
MKEFLLSAKGRDFLVEEYGNKARSTYDIATELETYANMVRRALVFHAIPLRDKGTAQKAALDSGRHIHPTKGTKRSQAVKEAISESMAKAWQGMSQADKDSRVEKARQQWQAMSVSEQENLRSLASEGMRRAAVDGSRLEQYLVVCLKAAGYQVEFHREFLVVAEKMHVDIYLPKLKTAIEIDGPSHFLPIWGEEELAKRIAADNRKTGLLVQNGLACIRIKNMSKNLSGYQERHIFKMVAEALEQIKATFPPLDKRLIELEL